MANKKTSGALSHEKVETSNFLMIVLILLVLLVGGLVEIVPLRSEERRVGKEC